MRAVEQEAKIVSHTGLQSSNPPFDRVGKNVRHLVFGIELIDRTYEICQNYKELKTVEFTVEICKTIHLLAPLISLISAKNLDRIILMSKPIFNIRKELAFMEKLEVIRDRYAQLDIEVKRQ